MMRRPGIAANYLQTSRQTIQLPATDLIKKKDLLALWRKGLFSAIV
jgi:hypothetical protein